MKVAKIPAFLAVDTFAFIKVDMGKSMMNISLRILGTLTNLYAAVVSPHLPLGMDLSHLNANGWQIARIEKKIDTMFSTTKQAVA